MSCFILIFLPNFFPSSTLRDFMKHYNCTITVLFYGHRQHFPPPPSFITFIVFACQDTFMAVEMIASLLIKPGVSLGAPYNLSQCSQQQLLVCSWATDTCPSSPDVLPDMAENILLYSISHTGLCTASFQSLLLLSSLVSTPGLLPLETMKIYRFSLHSNYTNNLKENISFAASHFCWECCVLGISPTLLFNVTGNQASSPHSILYKAACIVADSWLSIQHSLVAWFICISSSQRITSVLSVLKCGT